MKRIGLVTAVYGAVEPAESCFRHRWPNTQRYVLHDEYLYELHGRENQLTDEMYQRVRALLRLSADSGVDAILFAGSLWGECVIACRDEFSIPILTAYESLIDKALSLPTQSKLVSLATVAGTIKSFAEDFERTCDGHTELHSVLVDGAMGALAAGDRARHDELICACASGLDEHDVILLSQFSMESVAQRLRSVTGKPVYSSVDLAVEKLRSVVNN